MPWSADVKPDIDKDRNNMIILIAGASHTGKTFLAQRLLEKYRYPYAEVKKLKTFLFEVSFRT